MCTFQFLILTRKFEKIAAVGVLTLDESSHSSHSRPFSSPQYTFSLKFSLPHFYMCFLFCLKIFFFCTWSYCSRLFCLIIFLDYNLLNNYKICLLYTSDAADDLTR